MASYHFRVKTDTKSDGSRVSASVHVDYISRQGKYKNEGGKKNSETNFIAFADTKNLGEETFPLYLTDDFGKIFYTPKGLQVSGKYSPTTLLIALSLAKNMSDNQPLILKGSQKFKKATFKAAVDSEMELTFADENFQRSFYVTKERRKFEERKFEEQGGKIITTRSIQKSNIKKFNKRTISDAADAGFNLQVLSAKSVANAKSTTATGVFLSRDELDKLVARGRKNNPAVRWNFSSEQRNLAEQTSQKILQNLEEMKTKIFATSHFEYINREKKYASRGDCIFTHIITCQVGRMIIRKIFLKRRISTKVKIDDAMLRLNFLCPMN